LSHTTSRSRKRGSHESLDPQAFPPDLKRARDHADRRTGLIAICGVYSSKRYKRRVLLELSVLARARDRVSRALGVLRSFIKVHVPMGGDAGFVGDRL
jgi:hypothetical protein